MLTFWQSSSTSGWKQLVGLLIFWLLTPLLARLGNYIVAAVVSFFILFTEKFQETTTTTTKQNRGFLIYTNRYHCSTSCPTRRRNRS